MPAAEIEMRLTLIAILLMVNTVFSEIVPDVTQVYKRIGDVELNIYIFSPPNTQPGDQHPAIVFFYGGGWSREHPDQFFRHSKYLAERGMVACCADYRVKEKHGTTPQECVKDGKSAMRWVRSHASELGIDADRIAASGGSAGGHVAAATATIDGFNELGEDTTVSERPNAPGAVSIRFLTTAPDGWGHERVKAYWREFSPAHHIDSTTPPAVVFLGTADKVVPVSIAERFKKTMEDAGVRCDLHLYEGLGHGFYLDAKYNETLLEMDRFLTSLGYLEQ